MGSITMKNMYKDSLYRDEYYLNITFIVYIINFQPENIITLILNKIITRINNLLLF